MQRLLKQFLLAILVLAKHIECSINHLLQLHVKFEESNAFVKNVVEIDSLGEDMEKISLKDSPIKEDKQEPNGEVQKDEVENSQPLPKD